MKLNNGQLIGIVIVVASLALIIYQATRTESSVTFYTPEEVYATPEKFVGKIFRVSGLVLKGTKTWDASTHDLSFRISDLQSHEFNVHYKGIPPDLFKEGQGVIIEGKLLSQNANLNANHQIEANLLMVKHSEVYDTQKDHSKLKEAKMMESILQENTNLLGKSTKPEKQ